MRPLQCRFAGLLLEGREGAGLLSDPSSDRRCQESLEGVKVYFQRLIKP
jgi:hypothetical protein